MAAPHQPASSASPPLSPSSVSTLYTLPLAHRWPSLPCPPSLSFIPSISLLVSSFSDSLAACLRELNNVSIFVTIWGCLPLHAVGSTALPQLLAPRSFQGDCRRCHVPWSLWHISFDILTPSCILQRQQVIPLPSTGNTLHCVLPYTVITRKLRPRSLLSGNVLWKGHTCISFL